jgi:hypothetical protein
MSDQLELAQTPDLLAELTRRFKAAAFVGMKELTNKQNETTIWHNGEPYVVIGMLNSLAHTMQSDSSIARGYHEG